MHFKAKAMGHPFAMCVAGECSAATLLCTASGATYQHVDVELGGWNMCLSGQTTELHFKFPRMSHCAVSSREDEES